jgi:PAS domain S-box-containing protein
MDPKTIPVRPVSSRQVQPRDKVRQNWDQSISFRALFEQTGECIFIISLDFRYITANQQALSLLGYEEEELANKPVDEVLSQDATVRGELFSDHNSQIQERVLKCKNGFRIPVEISTTIVYDDNHEPAYIQSIARDISLRKNQERTLKRNAQILSIISEGTARLLQSSDIDTKIPSLLEALGKAMNIACCAIFTIDAFSEAFNAQVRYEWRSSTHPAVDITTIIEPSIPQILESKIQSYSPADDEIDSSPEFVLSFIAIPINGTIGAKGFLGFFDEASSLDWSRAEMDALQTAANLISAALQRKRYEETIRLSEVRNRILIDSLPDVIIRVDTQGNILDYSANSNHPLYIHRDLAYGRKLDKTFPEEIVSQIIGEENRENFFSPQKVDEFRLPYANGTYEARLYPIYADEALIIIRDVTEQVKLNEMKSDFINRASHELRTPLTAAMLMVDLIQEGGTAEEMDECWRTLKGELHRQKELIDRLLMAGRLESGMLKIEARVIDLMPVLRESMQSVQPIIAKRHISLQLTEGQSQCKVWGDTSGLQQVFINLINNAAKFSPENSTVEIMLSQNETQVKVAILDKGVGIPQEDIPHRFKRFYRAKNVTVAEIPGSGIGLYIVNSIISELGGEILVESVPNEGTTFTICLRRAETQPL